MSSGVRDSLQVVKIVGENGFTSEWLDLNERLTSSLRRGRLSLLVGSGISQYAPCTVPYAGEISSFLTSGMLEALPPELHSEEYSSAIRLPFEVLMARLAELDTQVARDIAFILTDAVHPNPVHEQIATIIQHCAEGAADFSVITTNYDTGITCGIAERKKLGLWPCGLPIPRTVTRPEDIDPPCSGPEIFHVHGITTDLSTLVLDYKEEFSLASWKKAHLAELVRDRDLFIVGFSGWDLDICKALAECEPSSIAWLRRDELECANWSRDAREVLDLCPVIAVNAENDLQNVLSHLAGTAPRPLTRSEDQIRRRFTEIGAKYNIPEQPWFRVDIQPCAGWLRRLIESGSFVSMM